MKKYISLMSILALAACASGGSPDGRFTVTSTSRIPFVTENAITSNQDVTSMDSAVVVCDGNCPAIVGKYISDMNSLRPHRDASVAAERTRFLRIERGKSAFSSERAVDRLDDPVETSDADDRVDLRRHAIRPNDDLRIGARWVDLYVDVDCASHGGSLLCQSCFCSCSLFLIIP